MNAYVKLNIENQVGYIEFFHPEHNSLPTNLLTQLAQTINDAGNNGDIKVIVLKSAGNRTFCAGASFKELVNINDEESGKVFFSGFANVINAMRNARNLLLDAFKEKQLVVELELLLQPIIVWQQNLLLLN